ncbi:zinc finger CCHC domain-containing protein 3-like [Gastrophryne carolinensis]
MVGSIGEGGEEWEGNLTTNEHLATVKKVMRNGGQLTDQRTITINGEGYSASQNAWSRGAPFFSPGLHYTGQAFKRRNVVRFKNKGAKEDLSDRRHVIRELLCNQMVFTPADILAVINLPDRQGYDISFKLMASLDRFWASVTKFRGADGWDQFILIPVSKPGTVSVNILFWNESVPPQDIVIWLRRHCNMVSDLTKCLDDDGIWTGGWRVLVKLRQHSNVTLHLPNSFFIGRERGVCFYAGQPRLCFKCGKAGHVAGVCTVVKCNLCGEIGHTSAMCTNVRCNLCVLRHTSVILKHSNYLVSTNRSPNLTNCLLYPQKQKLR